MQKLNVEDTVEVLKTMRIICGLSYTEKEALDNAVDILEDLLEKGIIKKGDELDD